MRLEFCDARGALPARDYAVVDELEIDEVMWRVIEIRPLPRTEGPAPPGTFAGTVAATLVCA